MNSFMYMLGNGGVVHISAVAEPPKRPYYTKSRKEAAAVDFAALWDKTAFLLTHVTVFELPLVFMATAAAAYVLSRILARHNARAREARLARRVAAVYAGLLAFIIAAKFLLV